MKKILLLLSISIIITSCGKAFLDAKPIANIVIPQSAEDFEAILDGATGKMNWNSTHAFGIIGGDEYYVTDATWNAPNQFGPSASERHAYNWDINNLYEPITQNADWNLAYHRILNANIVLEGVEKYRDTNPKWRVIEGRALFFRAINYYQLAQLFCKGFDQATADTDRGLPLKLISDLTERPKISTLKETYKQIEDDIQGAIDRLPKTEAILTRPTKLACYALLARLTLNQRRFDESLSYSNKILSVKSELFDFNKLNMASNPFSSFSDITKPHPEVIFELYTRTTAIISYGYFNADTLLYKLYLDNDLRKEVYFMDYIGTTMFRGGYGGNGAFFTGFATDEIYLIKAEILARQKNTVESLNLLNKLRALRFKKDTYIPLTSTDPDEVLQWVLRERRLQLYVRGVRWEDLKRLGSEFGNGIHIQRKINNEVISTNIDNNFAWPIPLNVMELGGY